MSANFVCYNKKRPTKVGRFCSVVFQATKRSDTHFYYIMFEWQCTLNFRGQIYLNKETIDTIVLISTINIMRRLLSFSLPSLYSRSFKNIFSSFRIVEFIFNSPFYLTVCNSIRLNWSNSTSLELLHFFNLIQRTLPNKLTLFQRLLRFFNWLPVLFGFNQVFFKNPRIVLF